VTQDNLESAAHEDMFPHQLTEVGKKYVDAVMNVQIGLLDELRQANEEWIASAQSRLALASDLCAKLMAARSLPDAAAACQEWTQQRADLLVEDGRHAFIHGQKLMEAGTRFFSNGSPNGTM
jgi:Phasin protein